MPQEDFHAGVDESWLDGWLHSWDLKPAPAADGQGDIDTGSLPSGAFEKKIPGCMDELET